MGVKLHAIHARKQKSSMGIWRCLPVLICFAAMWWMKQETSSIELIEVEKMRKFEHWIEDNGGIIKHVQLASFPGMGNGVMATANIREKDMVLFIPKQLIM